MTKTRQFLLATVSLWLIGCYSYEQNPRLDQVNPEAGYRYELLNQASPENSDSLFVVVTFSGGGTRAAALAYGILQQLNNTKIQWQGEEKTLLQEVDIISSVSGGSFTSAYYGLNRAATFNGDYEQNYLKKNVEQDLLWQLFNPINWIKLLSPSYARSDLVNEYYQANLFGEQTFTDLQKHGKPFVMINGTDMTTGGQFPFIQDQFDLICSDLSQYPVSRAVATSSAFPGMLTPLTYRNYAGSCKYQEPLWVSNGADDPTGVNPERVQFIDDRRSYYFPQPYREKRDYIHLMDGGVADNIGLRSLTFGLENTGPSYSLLRRINQEKIQKLVVIVVNAATDPANGLDQSAAVPGLITTVTASATVPLDNFTFDTISRSEDAIATVDEDVELVKNCNSRLKDRCPKAKPVAEEPIQIDSYVSVVSFNSIHNAEERYWFKNLPTNFNLPPSTIDKLLEIGPRLLQKSPAFKQLLEDIGSAE